MQTYKMLSEERLESNGLWRQRADCQNRGYICQFQNVMQVVWLEETLQAAAAGQLRTRPLNFADRVFQNEIDSAIKETRQASLPSLLSIPILLRTLCG